MLRYPKRTIQLGILYRRVYGATREIISYVDADYVDDLDKRRSITGFVFRVCGGAISWNASLQSVVAKYIALTEAIKKTLWLKGSVCELGFEQQIVSISCGNSSAIQLSKNPKYHEKTNHIDVRMHFIIIEISTSAMNVVKIPSEINPIFMLTKPLPTIKFKDSWNLIGILSL